MKILIFIQWAEPRVSWICFWMGSFLITVLALRWEGKINWSNSVLHCLQSCALGLFAVVERKTAKPGERLVAIVQEKQAESASQEMFWRKRNADYMRREERALFIEIKKNESFIYTCRKKEDFMCVSFKCSLKFINIISLNPFKMWIFMNDHRRNGSGCNPKR